MLRIELYSNVESDFIAIIVPDVWFSLVHNSPNKAYFAISKLFEVFGKNLQNSTSEPTVVRMMSQTCKDELRASLVELCSKYTTTSSKSYDFKVIGLLQTHEIFYKMLVEKNSYLFNFRLTKS